MKTRTILVALILLIGTSAHAQLLKKLGKRAERAAEETVLRKSEQKVAKETGDAIDTVLDGKKEEEKTNSKDIENNDDPTNNSADEIIDEEAWSSKDMNAWSKYNFVPGDEIIFYDDLANEESGEFPSRWDLLNGNAENASLAEEKVINLLNKAKITPLMEKDSYLPEVFTIEFDAFFKRLHGPTYQYYSINLWSGSKNYGYSEDGKSYCGSITINMHGASMACIDNSNSKKYSSFDESLVVGVGEPVWRHIAIAFNKRSLKVFIDENRVLNIPNLDYKPEAFVLAVHANYEELSAVKNIRIAEGGKKLYDRVIADGKFVTRGILFDVNKATIKQESMGVINEVAKMMTEHPDLNFSIEGHTDSDGADDYNLKLSEQRAVAVKEALTKLGVAKGRFQAIGLGESVPVADNTSPEGKANNRRVEFVKI